MGDEMKLSKRKAIISEECVACGSCIGSCPRQAISVPLGIRAQVDELKCVGCGKCVLTCPAGVINIVERAESEGERHE